MWAAKAVDDRKGVQTWNHVMDARYIVHMTTRPHSDRMSSGRREERI